MTRKTRPELPAGTEVRLRGGRAGLRWFRITGTEAHTTAAGSRIYRGVNIAFGHESTFSECDVVEVSNG